ncbi:MAG TPA: ParA family protein [Synergistales bacterium]|nr:ParA family protein [Synergistales bacterium]
MGKIISISNHKGGVGKTTSTVNIGAGLSQGKSGKTILLVDLDPQANLSQSLDVFQPDYTVYGALRGEYPLKPIEITPKLHLVASTLDLSGAEVELSSEPGREYILRDLLEPLRGKYDYILIDCPPSLGLLTVNALSASDEIYIPLQTQYLALQGITKLMEVVEKIRARLNKKLELGGVILTQFDSRKILDRDVASSISNHFKDKVFKTRIRDNVSLAEAPTQGKDIFRYSPKSMGAEDYASLCQEILKNSRNHDKHGNKSKQNNRG